MNIRRHFLLSSLLALPAVLGCKEESSGSTAPSSSGPASTQGVSVAAVADGVRAPIPTPKPVPRVVDENLSPGVWVSVNGRADPEVAPGWPLIVTATVLGAAGPAAEFSVDDVSIGVTDAAGAKVAWPMSRVSKSTKLKVDHTTGATVTWVAGDVSSQPAGIYLVTAVLKGGTSHAVPVKLVPAPAKETAERKGERFGLDVRAAMLKGEMQAALRRAEERTAAYPEQMLGFEVMGDALAALGRKKEAHAAYSRAVALSVSEKPKAGQSPNRLLVKLGAVSGEK